MLDSACSWWPIVKNAKIFLNSLGSERLCDWFMPMSFHEFPKHIETIKRN